MCCEGRSTPCNSVVLADVTDKTATAVLAQDQDNVSIRLMQNQFEDLQEKSEQVHVALLALTRSESFDIVLGSSIMRSGRIETMGPSLGFSERREAQSTSATNLGSRSV